jgi:hypothetical protein
MIMRAVVVMVMPVICRTIGMMMIMVITSVIMRTLFYNILHNRIGLDSIIVVGEDMGSFFVLIYRGWPDRLAFFCVTALGSTDGFGLTGTIPHFVTNFNIHHKKLSNLL